MRHHAAHKLTTKVTMKIPDYHGVGYYNLARMRAALVGARGATPRKEYARWWSTLSLADRAYILGELRCGRVFDLSWAEFTPTLKQRILRSAAAIREKFDPNQVQITFSLEDSDDANSNRR